MKSKGGHDGMTGISSHVDQACTRNTAMIFTDGRKFSYGDKRHAFDVRGADHIEDP
jgi:hypothetical protein